VPPIDAREARASLPRRAEDDGECRVEGPQQSAERLVMEVRVLGHSRGDERMRDLEQERRCTPEQQERLTVHSPRDGVSGEDAGVGHNPSVPLVRSFRFALAGFRYLLTTQRNFRIELVIGVVALAAAVPSDFQHWEWAVLALTIALVLILEAVNTAIENAVTLASERFDPRARAAKDVSAAAVLIAAVASVAVGVALFGSRLVVAL